VNQQRFLSVGPVTPEDDQTLWCINLAVRASNLKTPKFVTFNGIFIFSFCVFFERSYKERESVSECEQSHCFVVTPPFNEFSEYGGCLIQCKSDNFCDLLPRRLDFVSFSHMNDRFTQRRGQIIMIIMIIIHSFHFCYVSFHEISFQRIYTNKFITNH
jgi:hypothetical protein